MLTDIYCAFFIHCTNLSLLFYTIVLYSILLSTVIFSWKENSFCYLKNKNVITLFLNVGEIIFVCVLLLFYLFIYLFLEICSRCVQSVSWGWILVGTQVSLPHLLILKCCCQSTSSSLAVSSIDDLPWMWRKLGWTFTIKAYICLALLTESPSLLWDISMAL